MRFMALKNTGLLTRQRMRGGCSFISYQSFYPSINFYYTTTLEAVKSNLNLQLPKNPLLLWKSFQWERFCAPGCKHEQRCQQLKSSTIPCFYLSPRTELTQVGIKSPKINPHGTPDMHMAAKWPTKRIHVLWRCRMYDKGTFDMSWIITPTFR